MKKFPASLFFIFYTTTILFGQENPISSKIDGKFYYLKDLYRHQNYFTSPSSPLGSIRFNIPPTESDLQRYEDLGVSFKYECGMMLHSATIYPASIPFSSLEILNQDKNIVFVQSAWRPMNMPPLWVSRPQIQAEQVWQLVDDQKRNVTGKGITLADFDTGVDFFHPMMWFADGDTLNWIDVDHDGKFTPGIDAVDLNKNGKADSTEILNYIEFRFVAAGNDTSQYDSDFDWLYNDANKNGVRDKGTASGFTESSPTYGEQWFVSLDANHNQRLDVGEKLVGLKTCKVRAIRAANGTVYRRGIDLISAPPDTGPYGGHGTSVAGIFCGGIPYEKKLSGIAPDAEFIVAEIQYNSSPRFYTDLATHLAWAQNEGAQIFLTEDGEWVWEFLDGSSNEEIMMNELARDKNVVFILPAGNLTGGGMMKTITVPKNDTVKVRMTVPPRLTSVWQTFLWKGTANDLTLHIQAPNNDTMSVLFNDQRVLLDSSKIFSDLTISSRSTVRAAMEMSPVDSGLWVFTLRNQTKSDKIVYCYLGDNYFSWSGAARWIQPTEDNTVTWPATADSGICIAAYDPRNATNINYFSGRGKRLDGFAPVDVACPGSTVYSIGRNNRYSAFGGTSSAGPHGAGAAALLLQKFPNKKNSEIESLIHQGALKDSLTGNVPNSTWGWGKLRIYNSILSEPTNVTQQTIVPLGISLGQNYPNPFSSTTTIRFNLSSTLSSQERVTRRGEVRSILKVYDYLGREIKSFQQDHLTPGEYSISFNAEGLPSGVYFYRLIANGASITKQMVILK